MAANDKEVHKFKGDSDVSHHSLWRTMDELVSSLKQVLDNRTTLHNRKAKAKAMPRK